MASSIVPFPRPGANDDHDARPPSEPVRKACFQASGDSKSLIASLTSTDLLTAADYAEASSQAEPRKLEKFDSLQNMPDSYFVQLARDDRNAPLIRAGEIVVVDQGGCQRGGWLPREGGLFVIEYNGGLSDYPDQRYPRVSHDIVQTFRDHKGRWWTGGIQRGLVGTTFYADDGPYKDECHLADKLIGKVVGLYLPSREA
jgi:hypothetical protein